MSAISNLRHHFLHIYVRGLIAKNNLYCLSEQERAQTLNQHKKKKVATMADSCSTFGQRATLEHTIKTTADGQLCERKYFTIPPGSSLYLSFRKGKKTHSDNRYTNR